MSMDIKPDDLPKFPPGNWELVETEINGSRLITEGSSFLLLNGSEWASANLSNKGRPIGKFLPRWWLFPKEESVGPFQPPSEEAREIINKRNENIDMTDLSNAPEAPCGKTVFSGEELNNACPLELPSNTDSYHLYRWEPSIFSGERVEKGDFGCDWYAIPTDSELCKKLLAARKEKKKPQPIDLPEYRRFTAQFLKGVLESLENHEKEPQETKPEEKKLPHIFVSGLKSVKRVKGETRYIIDREGSGEAGADWCAYSLSELIALRANLNAFLDNHLSQTKNETTNE